MAGKSNVLWSTRRRVLLAGCVLTYLWFNLAGVVIRVAGVQADDYRGQIGPGVEAQLTYIRTVLHEPETRALQQPTPVWVVFAHTLYGFTLVNTVLLDPDNQARRAEAVSELKWILERLKRPEATRGFAPTQVPYGVFYLGERNLTLAGLMLVDPDPDPRYEQEFHYTSRILYDAFMASPSANLETFPGFAWPTDNVPALYSLVIHDRLYGTDYGQAASRWVEMMRPILDPGTGLMPAKIDYETAAVLNVPRGCALSFTFAFLPDFAPQFAEEQYAAYRQHFLKTTLGFAGWREYPPGRGHWSDIDSGPIFLGVGAAATGIGIAATKATGDDSTFESIVQLSEIIGLPAQRGGQKFYLLGRLLIGDIIQVWGKTMTPWSLSPAANQSPSTETWPPIESISLVPFYGIASIVGETLLLLTFLLVWYIHQQPGFATLLRGRTSQLDIAGMFFFGGQAVVWLVVWAVPVFGLVGVLALSGLLEILDLLNGLACV